MPPRQWPPVLCTATCIHIRIFPTKSAPLGHNLGVTRFYPVFILCCALRGGKRPVSLEHPMQGLVGFLFVLVGVGVGAVVRTSMVMV